MAPHAAATAARRLHKPCAGGSGIQRECAREGCCGSRSNLEGLVEQVHRLLPDVLEHAQHQMRLRSRHASVSESLMPYARKVDIIIHNTYIYIYATPNPSLLLLDSSTLASPTASTVTPPHIALVTTMYAICSNPLSPPLIFFIAGTWSHSTSSRSVRDCRCCSSLMLSCQRRPSVLKSRAGDMRVYMKIGRGM
jgi:hypothetical protein